MKEKIFNAFRIVVLAFILSSAIGYSLADWTPPSGTPPFNNVPPPINVGPTTQVKDGNLFINNLLWAKKARSVSTDAADTGDTLVTKDYLDTLVTKDYRGMLQGSCIQSRNPGCPWTPGCHNLTSGGPTQCTDTTSPASCTCEAGYTPVIIAGVHCNNVEAYSCVKI